MLLEVHDFAVVDLTVRVFHLPVPNHVILLPLPADDLAGREDERALSVELVAEAVADVLIAVEELEVPLDLDSVLVDASR